MELQLVNERRRAPYAAKRLSEFAARCRKAGLAVTPQRLAIIKVLLTSAEHPRADSIFAAVRREHPTISLATVHRTLETLCEIGEARKVTMLHDSARYDGIITWCASNAGGFAISRFPRLIGCSKGVRSWESSPCSDRRSKSRRCAKVAT